MNYANPTEASKIYGVCTATLREWANEGKIDFIKTEGGHRRYCLPIEKIEDSKKSYIYARVSSKKQENDLGRQIEFIKSRYPNYEIIKDIGSGLNFKRKGFRKILEQLFQGNINEVIISSSDRFSRLGAKEFFEWLFIYFGGKLTTLNDNEYKSKDEELSEELLEIITVFTARHYGTRSYSSDKKNKNLPESYAEKTI